MATQHQSTHCAARRSACRPTPVLLALSLAAPMAVAQSSPPGQPEIVTNGNATISLPPDRAVVRIGVATRAATASAASSPNGPLVTRVVDTLRALNLPGTPARAISFGVAPNYDFSKGRQIIDYEARTTLEVILKDVASLARLLDAALGAGATDITSIAFESDSSATARHRALATALKSARDDAEAIASAAGGRLGPLLLVTTSPETSGVAMRAAETMSFSVAGLPAVRRDVVIYATVQARWVFLGPRQ